MSEISVREIFNEMKSNKGNGEYSISLSILAIAASLEKLANTIRDSELRRNE